MQHLGGFLCSFSTQHEDIGDSSSHSTSEDIIICSEVKVAVVGQMNGDQGFKKFHHVCWFCACELFSSSVRCLISSHFYLFCGGEDIRIMNVPLLKFKLEFLSHGT